MQPGSAIINTGSVTGQLGSGCLLDYSMTKGGIHAFTRSLATHLVPRGIRVNAVAPGPVCTPLNPSGKEAEAVREFGARTPMKRPAQPEEIAPAYFFLAPPQCSSCTPARFCRSSAAIVGVKVADGSKLALILVDIINHFEFPEGDQTLRHTLAIAPALTRLKKRARRAGVPAIYVNDNFGQWRSDAAMLVKYCLREDAPGRSFVEQLWLGPEGLCCSGSCVGPL